MSQLKEGMPAPDFKGVSDNGELVSLVDFKGKKLILFFYPKADTPGCTAEACSLRDAYADLRDRGFALLGVSPDTTKKQGNFRKKYDLPFPLLADTEQEVLKAYGAWGEKQMYGKTYEGVLRTTFVIDEQGTIEKIFTKVDTKNHAVQILEAMGA
ncbi:MAG TPA: thioredoxin-dependent thiol peroxidase [Saprospiraceae bacterium]|nr:thioredoxin-dependent thiol peroxidase [Saprospiraceae bacterium]HMP14100.1 thioredoxin-dependent thiol peroxidase [Saprospiraceae bacterium]